MLTRLFLSVFVGLCIASAPASAAGMMVIHHKVADYAKWRPVFDGDKAHQEAVGLTNPHVYQAVDNPNDVTITFDMSDAAKAKAFGTSKDLKTAMTKAGVKGKPEILYLNPAS